MDTNIQNAILDLIIAIKENDLSTAKINVALLNDNIDYFINETQTTYLNNVLSLSTMINTYPNETLLYIMENLQPLYNTQQIAWNLKVRLLLNNKKNIEEIKSFIKQNLEYLDEPYKFYGLIQLATTIQDYDLIYQIKQMIN